MNMSSNTIWDEYALILLAVFSLLFGCIRDGWMDKLIARIPLSKWNVYNRRYKYRLIRCNRCSVKVNRKWLAYITVGLLFGAGGLYQIELYSLSNHLLALMFVTTTFVWIFPLKETIEQHKYEFSTKELIMLIVLSITTLSPKILFGTISDFNVMDGVRVSGIWVTYWLMCRYIPLQVCNILIWAIKISKKMVLKEAYKENALRNFLKFSFAAVLGLCMTQINEMIDFGDVVSDFGCKWFALLLGR